MLAKKIHANLIVCELQAIVNILYFLLLTDYEQK